MKKSNCEDIKGYIEGYYGRLLSWTDRNLIINSLKKNKMNTYFYAPKEDKNHRLVWREKYSLKWRKSFSNFTNFAKLNKINIIAGIAPGLDFNFKQFNNISNEFAYSDFNVLLNKAKQLLKDGSENIALLLDDIPGNFDMNFGSEMSEGTSHALLANKLSYKLGKSIYFVPRIYADELIEHAPNYLYDLGKTLNPDIKVFYCGKNVISKNLSNYSKIKKILTNKIIFWDNYYANDYCPRRLYIGPYFGRKQLNSFMINPTGLINTDLLILDIVTHTKNERQPLKIWLKILKKHNIPVVFNKIRRFFLKPNFSSKPSFINQKISKKDFCVLEYLLWSWKTELSREWYPHLFGLKHDLQINERILNTERIIKTQTIPLANYICKMN